MKRDNQRGSALVEFAGLVSLVTIICIASVSQVGDKSTVNLCKAAILWEKNTEGVSVNTLLSWNNCVSGASGTDGIGFP